MIITPLKKYLLLQIVGFCSYEYTKVPTAFTFVYAF